MVDKIEMINTDDLNDKDNCRTFYVTFRIKFRRRFSEEAP